MDLGELLTRQDGVVSRAQVLAAGGEPHEIRRRLRRREWAVVVPGVYVDHTGPLTWEQRAMAGVLHAASSYDAELRPLGAGLGGHAALRHAVGRSWREHGPIEVCIERDRRLARVAGYRFSRVTDLGVRLDERRTPPRLRPAEAALDLALRASDLLEVVQVVADACQTRCVSAAQVVEALEARPQVIDRATLRAVLTDVAQGTCSALEHLFLEDVVRAHGLPLPGRQVARRTEGGTQHRDVEWEGRGVVVELDGRLFHDNARQRDRDLERDLDDVVAGRTAIRLGWGQVTRSRCRTAQRLAALLGCEATGCQ